jgi:transcriptional regulator with XRE-family HTH domain
MSISEQLRAAILAGPATQYRIALETGVAKSVLSRFIHGQQGIGLATADKLAEFLGMELVKAGRRPNKKGR